MTIDIRAQALALAQQCYTAGPEEAILALAAKYATFISGAEDAPAPSKAGRKAKGEVDGKAVVPESTATPVATPTVTTPAATPVVLGTKEAMKAAVLAYKDATDQATALKLLTDVGAENFGAVKPELYQQVTDAATAALDLRVRKIAGTSAKKEVDPFADTDEVVAPTVTLADVKKAFVGRQKDVSESALLDVLKNLGAVGAGAPGQPLTPSLKFLAADKFAAAIAAVNALPKTK